MISDLIENEEYFKYTQNIAPNKVLDFFSRVSTIVLADSELKDIELELVQDESTASNPQVCRYFVVLKSRQKKLTDLFNQKGPFILYIKQF